jgi:hypothetical protein
MLNSLKLQELNNDQRREVVNTQQRYAAWLDAKARLAEFRGSMVWQTVNGADYLARSAYTKQGVRKQTSLGPRSEATEAIKRDFERARDEAKARFKEIDTTLNRQAAINRALGLGRVPMMGARIIRALADIGALGAGLRIVGTNAIYAYEAVAGVTVDSGLTTTGDIDLLFDSRGGLRFIVSDDISERSLLAALRDVDKSFQRTRQTFRAQNAEGYLVDLIKPIRSHLSKRDEMQVGDDAADLVASEIEGLVWLENAPTFEAIAIDERGFPLKIVAVDPRVWAIHKHWIAQRLDRDPLKKQRDAEQAIVVGAIVARHLVHLPFEPSELRMLPLDLVEQARPLFSA